MYKLSPEIKSTQSSDNKTKDLEMVPENIIKEELGFSKNVNLYEFFLYYDTITIVELFGSIAIIYVFLMKVLFDVDFV